MVGPIHSLTQTTLNGQQRRYRRSVRLVISVRYSSKSWNGPRQGRWHSPSMPLSRAEERGIEVTPTLLERLSDSVERAEAKGATIFWRWTRAWPLSSTFPTAESSPHCLKKR